MHSLELSIVPLESIPPTPYSTPSSDLSLIYSTAKKMESICRESRGIGLAAAQVGLPWRLFVALEDYPLNQDKFGIFFDCEYEVEGKSTFPSVEGCLSLPGKQYRVERYERVTVVGKRIVETDDTYVCEDFRASFSGVAAVLMQHEIDHDRGRERMIDTIGIPVSLVWP